MTPDKWFAVAVVAFMVVLGCVVMAVRNARLNRRDDAREMRDLQEADLGGTDLGAADAGGEFDRVATGPQTVLADQVAFGDDGEDQLDDEWPDTLAAMNVELHSGTPVSHHLAADLEQYHEPCQEWCCWERRLEAQRAAWLELVRADVTVVAEWIVAGTPGRWVPSAAGWPSDDWRGEMIPA